MTNQVLGPHLPCEKKAADFESPKVCYVLKAASDRVPVGRVCVDVPQILQMTVGQVYTLVQYQETECIDHRLMKIAFSFSVQSLTNRLLSVAKKDTALFPPDRKLVVPAFERRRIGRIVGQYVRPREHPLKHGEHLRDSESVDGDRVPRCWRNGRRDLSPERLLAGETREHLFFIGVAWPVGAKECPHEFVVHICKESRKSARGFLALQSREIKPAAERPAFGRFWWRSVGSMEGRSGPEHRGFVRSGRMATKGGLHCLDTSSGVLA